MPPRAAGHLPAAATTCQWRPSLDSLLPARGRHIRDQQLTESAVEKRGGRKGERRGGEGEGREGETGEGSVLRREMPRQAPRLSRKYTMLSSRPVSSDAPACNTSNTSCPGIHASYSRETR